MDDIKAIACSILEHVLDVYMLRKRKCVQRKGITDFACNALSDSK